MNTPNQVCFDIAQMSAIGLRQLPGRHSFFLPAEVDILERQVLFFELVKDAAPQVVFESFGVDLVDLCLTEAQIRWIVHEHRFLLREDGVATAFLLYDRGLQVVLESHLAGRSIRWLLWDAPECYAEQKVIFVVPVV